MLVAAPTQTPPAGWTWTGGVPGVQLVAASVAAAPDPEAVVLTGADVPEILDLVERTQPGPFRKRTIDLGTYLGIRRDGALIAMAERADAPARLHGDLRGLHRSGLPRRSAWPRG
nr:hypothetical protein GCM10020092_047740 [Actinoplanes digitatis]